MKRFLIQTRLDILEGIIQPESRDIYKSYTLEQITFVRNTLQYLLINVMISMCYAFTYHAKHYLVWAVYYFWALFIFEKILMRYKNVKRVTG